MSINSLLKSIAFAVFCALLAYGGFRAAQLSMNDSDRTSAASNSANQTRSDLDYETFDLSHEFINLSGNLEPIATDETRLYLINFWATWCAPCVTEMPLLERVAQDYASQGLTVVGLSNDDSIATVSKFLKTIPVTYPLYMNDNATIAATSQLNPIGAIPFTLFVNAEGDILETKLGIFDDEGLRSQIDGLLQE